MRRRVRIPRVRSLVREPAASIHRASTACGGHGHGHGSVRGGCGVCCRDRRGGSRGGGGDVWAGGYAEETRSELCDSVGGGGDSVVVQTRAGGGGACRGAHGAAGRHRAGYGVAGVRSGREALCRSRDGGVQVGGRRKRSPRKEGWP